MYSPTNKILIKLLLLFGLFCAFTNAQEMPPVQIYNANNYNGEMQNWDISQDANDNIYVANNRGLLAFNGGRWQLYPSPNETIMRSVLVSGDRIYTGCYMEFGYWKKNALGTLDYTSISKDLDTPLIEDEQFWSILELDRWFLFQSLNRIYVYDTIAKTFKIIESENIIVKSYKVDQTIYFQKKDEGLFKIENGEEIMVNNNAILTDNNIVNIFSMSGEFLIQTQDKGIFVLEGNELTSWETSINKKLQELSVYNSIQLSNGNFAFGTISKGVYIASINGELLYSINQTNGLSNNTVLSLFEDAQQNIWLGLDNGINCLNSQAPIKVFQDAEGKIGAVYTAAIYNERLYLGTNQGLFSKRLQSDEAFTFTEGTQGQVWHLAEIQGSLFCGHNSGTFVLNKDDVKKLPGNQGTWKIEEVPNNPNLLIQGNYDGLSILEKENSGWKQRNKLKGFNNSSRFFEFLDDNTILLSHEYKGVFKIEMNQAFNTIKNTEFIQIEKGLNSSMVKFDGDVFYAYRKGVFKYLIDERKFLKDSLLSSLYNDNSYVTGKLVADEKTKTLWSFSKDQIKYIEPSKLSATLKVNTIQLPYRLIHSVNGYENVIRLDDKKYLIGTSKGYLTISLNTIDQRPFKITIDAVSNSEIRENGTPNLINFREESNFSSGYNNIEIAYSVPKYDKFFKTQYQYKLDGIYNEWSEWSTTKAQYFENLPHGSYKFEVRAQNNNQLSTNIASYEFKIERPWHLSNLMILLYILGVILFSLIMHNAYKQYYKRQRETLLLQKQKELELKDLEGKQQIMRLENEKLEQSVESKNRELAISIMSLIKKKEFLNSIKDDLIKTDTSQSIKKIISTIDKNLNDTDDWKLFEEAFNNADKDFLKKIKTKHDNLTPNDLRLCAYLRLNLSSKEIAPLLNISPRSVEVKRYRLRKKMSLPHETSLTNYILEL